MRKWTLPSDVVAACTEGARAAAHRTQTSSPIVPGILVTLLSALGVFLCSTLLEPLVFYAYWNAICWPVDGLIIGVLLLCSRKHWPWILAGYVFASVSGLVSAHTPPPAIFMDVVCNLFEMAFAALSLPAFGNLSEWLRRPRLILRFSVLAVIVGPLLSAMLWSTFTFFYYHWDVWIIIRNWVSGDALGIALFTPLVLILFSRETYLLVRSDRWMGTLLTFGVLIGASWSVFHQTAYPIAFVLFPVLVVIVNRIGLPGAVLAVNLLTVIAAKATIQGTGPFLFVRGPHEPYRIMTLQIYLTMAMIMSFAITLTALERNDFQEQLKLALQQMEVLATHDGLTGLGNRRLFDQTLEAEWARARRDGNSIALLMLDADCFKSYNDMYGHIAGDQCLCAIAASVRATVMRGGDLVARYGGEEFVVLLPGLALDQASQVAESVREGIESLRIEHKGNKSSCVTISIGCSAAVPDWQVASQHLVATADEALYAAKQGGRNRVECGVSLPVLTALAPTGTG